jgi:vacuolar iron transporter family protein
VAATSEIETGLSAIDMEVFAVTIYSYLAKFHPATSEDYLRLAEKESNHILFWKRFLEKRGVEAVVKPPNKNKLVTYKIAIRLLGKGLTLRILGRDEAASIELYAGLLSSLELTDEEKKGIQKILEDELVHEEEFIKKQSEIGDFMIYIKDAVLGLNDGLVEILAVTTGLVGVYNSPNAVAIGGLVVGVAGALSMGLSTYTSSRSQRQVQEGVIRRLSSASRLVTAVFKDRVKQNSIDKGYSEALAVNIAEETASDTSRLSGFIAEEEYGLKEKSMGIPSRAALYAGGANLLGMVIPLAPYFFIPDITSALILSLVFATLFLAITGLLVSLLANISARTKIVEMVITGLGSASASYIVGWVASVVLSTRVV